MVFKPLATSSSVDVCTLITGIRPQAELDPMIFSDSSQNVKIMSIESNGRIAVYGVTANETYRVDFTYIV